MSWGFNLISWSICVCIIPSCFIGAWAVSFYPFLFLPYFSYPEPNSEVPLSEQGASSSFPNWCLSLLSYWCNITVLVKMLVSSCMSFTCGPDLLLSLSKLPWGHSCPSRWCPTAKEVAELWIQHFGRASLYTHSFGVISSFYNFSTWHEPFIHICKSRPARLQAWSCCFLRLSWCTAHWAASTARK